MTKILFSAAALSLLASCEPVDRQNSAMCGLTMMASGNRILDQMNTRTYNILEAAPTELQADSIPTRVIGHAVGHSVGAAADSGVVLGYVGEGFPPLPGFGVALVDDSSEVFRGVTVFLTEPPQYYPSIGNIAGSTNTIPLYGLRIHWSSVNSEECPLFPVPTPVQ